MRVLGSFQYHIFAAQSLADEDERECKVTCSDNIPGVTGTEHTTESIGEARDLFERIITRAIGATSRSMVIDFMQGDHV